MQLINYSDLKHGEYYLAYDSESTENEVIIFELNDQKPVMSSFTIILVKHKWGLDVKNKVELGSDYPTMLFPTQSLVYSLSEAEFQTQVLIPSI